MKKIVGLLLAGLAGVLVAAYQNSHPKEVALNSIAHREMAVDFFRGYAEGMAQVAGGALREPEAEVVTVDEHKWLAVKMSWASDAPRFADAGNPDANARLTEQWQRGFCDADLRADMTRLHVYMLSGQIRTREGVGRTVTCFQPPKAG